MVQSTGAPTVPLLGQVTVTMSVGAVMTMSAEPVAVWALLSVTVTPTVKVPAVLKVVVKLSLVPVSGVPPVAVHANV